MSTRAERRRAEKALKKLQNRMFTSYEVQELMNRARVDMLKLAVDIHEKTNRERKRETRENQFHLFLERQVRMRVPAMNRFLDENQVFMKREGGGNYDEQGGKGDSTGGSGGLVQDHTDTSAGDPS